MKKRNNLGRQSAADKLGSIAAEVSALTALGLQLQVQTTEALATLEPSEPLRGKALRQAAAVWLATAPAQEIRAELIEARGATAAAHLATDLNADLARLGKLRPAVRCSRARATVAVRAIES